jgi:predicted DNA binding CopG/RHH family protein
MKKEKQLNIRLTEEQDKKLSQKAEKLGLNKSEFVRFLILKEI